jgi:hypothetical protein
LASDLLTPGTIFITVSNPAPGGGISNSVFFEVTTPTQSLAFTRADTDLSTSLNLPSALTVFDYRNTGDPYLAVANQRCPANINCILQHATISIALDGLGLFSQTFTAANPGSIASGDFNGDGLLDLITSSSSGISISLNSSPPGTWSLHKDYRVPSGCSSPFAVGDFNQDGHLDVALSGSSGPCVLPGNGDGTFGAPVNSASATSNTILAVGDFNGDGKLDLATFSEVTNTISILLGNGDGTFQSAAPVNFQVGPFTNRGVAADFNGDGKLDLAVNNQTSVSIFLGNGDGTLKPNVDYPAGASVGALTIGDYNGDGILDFAVTDEGPANGSVNVILGNGDGTFQSHLDFAAAFPSVAIATGEFFYNGEQGGPVGRAGFATTNPQNNTVSLFVAIPTGPVNPLPTISSFSPSSALVNSGAFTLTVNGTNFFSGSTVYFRDQPRVTTFVNATQLTAAIQAGDLGSIGAVDVYVLNPTPGGGSSIVNVFNVYSPPPTISSLNPPSAVQGGPAFTLTVNGSNFVKGAAVSFSGSSGPTTFVSSTQLTVAISAAAIASQGTINVSVGNPLGNGGNGDSSPSLPFAILPTNTQPIVGALVPATTNAGGPAFTLIVAGSGFTTGSIVTFNSRVVSSAFVSQTQLQAAIPASSIAVAGTPFVTVANPGGNPSLVTTFTVNNPFPGTSSLAPSTVSAGSAAVTVNVTGTNFNTSSTVLVGGSTRATTYVSSTSLNASLPASDFVHSGTLSISVNNPAPGGGSTSALTITVTAEDFNVNVPTPTGIVTAGQPANFNLMVVVPANTSTANAITFSALGLPLGATATFSQSGTIPAGSSGTTSMMLSITTTPHTTASLPASPSGPDRSLPVSVLWIAAFSMMLGLGMRAMRVGPRRLVPQFVLTSMLLIAAGMMACGAPGGSSSSGQQINTQTGTPAGVYPITVTATSGSGSLSTMVSLTVM